MLGATRFKPPGKRGDRPDVTGSVVALDWLNVEIVTKQRCPLNPVHGYAYLGNRRHAERCLLYGALPRFFYLWSCSVPRLNVLCWAVFEFLCRNIPHQLSISSVVIWHLRLPSRATWLVMHGSFVLFCFVFSGEIEYPLEFEASLHHLEFNLHI